MLRKHCRVCYGLDGIASQPHTSYLLLSRPVPFIPQHCLPIMMKFGIEANLNLMGKFEFEVGPHFAADHCAFHRSRFLRLSTL